MKIGVTRFSWVVGLFLLSGWLGNSLFSQNISADDSTPMAPTERIELLNGKNLEGWTSCLKGDPDPAKTFFMDEGVLKCTGFPNGYLRTKKSYRDYKLTVEWRFLKIGPGADNTGVFIHTQLPDRVWPQAGVECEGQYGKQGDFVLMNQTTCKGNETTSPSRRIKMQDKPNENPVGQWNIMEIVARGSTLECSMNGKKLNAIEDLNISFGFIGLQSGNAYFEVRRLSLEPISNP
ncbi:MAG: DUF1080 domain-containing protein [Verrucomicrobiota bacterium]